jgi:uncharacterized protein (DUF58 family)
MSRLGLLPSRRLLAAVGMATIASFAVIAFPGAWLALAAVDAALLAILLIDLLVTPAPRCLDALRIAPERWSVQAAQPVTLVVRSSAGVPLRLCLRDTIPETFATSALELSGEVPPGGEARLTYEVTPRARGGYEWGALWLRYGSLLGLWERQRVVPATAPARVYPNLAALHRYHILARADRLDVLGQRHVRHRPGAWEFESLRDYLSGDDPRLLDWKATARRRRLTVRNLEAERNQTILLLVDCGRLMTAEVNGVSKLDHAVNAALVLGRIALARGDRVGLCTFSRAVQNWVVPRAHTAQARLLGEALYDQRGDFTESDHGRCLRWLSARHPKRALLVVLTDFVDAGTAADMVAHVALAGRRHLVLFVALGDPLLARAARARPADTREGFRKAAALELLHERREVLGQLRHHGAHVLDSEPGDVIFPLVTRYLEIAGRGLL